MRAHLSLVGHSQLGEISSEVVDVGHVDLKALHLWHSTEDHCGRFIHSVL